MTKMQKLKSATQRLDDDDDEDDVIHDEIPKDWLSCSTQIDARLLYYYYTTSMSEHAHLIFIFGQLSRRYCAWLTNEAAPPLAPT